MSKSSKTYTRYTEEFKADAVRLIEVQGLSVAQVARDLDVNVNTLHNWLNKTRESQAPEMTEMLRELNRLRKENAVLKEEREILKKAAAFFAKESK
ncbi:MAG: transposase [bacterium]